MKIQLSSLKAGELAALYILSLRGIVDEKPSEIQEALEALVGLEGTIEAIRTVRKAMAGV